MSSNRLTTVVVVALLLSALTAALVFVLSRHRIPIQVRQERSKVLHILRALGDYQDDHGHLPPATGGTTGSRNELVHSWRAYILDYAFHEPSQYDFDYPWFSEQNKHAALQAERFYSTVKSSRTDASSITNYVTFSGPDTALNGVSRIVKEPNLLPPDVIVLFSGSNLQIRPLEPTDLSVEELASFEGSISEYLDSDRDAVVLFGDASVWIVSKSAPARSFARLATLSGAMRYSRDDELRPWLVQIVKGPFPDSAQCDSPGLSDSGGGRIMVPEGGPKDERVEAGSIAANRKKGQNYFSEEGNRKKGQNYFSEEERGDTRAFLREYRTLRR